MANKTILIVEDERPLRQAMRDKLQRSDFTVLEAENGKEGLETAVREKPDLILLDLMMPILDGMSMLKELRAKNAWGKTAKVIILTNLSGGDVERIRDVAELTPLSYLVKSDLKIADVLKTVQDSI